jgi:Coenzyme PQQ synthesis protein D (PqqD)
MSTVYIARVKEVAARSIGGEMMIMSARDSTLFSLNETATAIWQAADGVTPLAEIVQHSVCAQFDVDPATALRDAEELVVGLAKHGILKLSDQPIVEAK